MDRIKQIIIIVVIAGLSVLAAKNNWLGKITTGDKPPEAEIYVQFNHFRCNSF